MAPFGISYYCVLTVTHRTRLPARTCPASACHGGKAGGTGPAPLLRQVTASVTVDLRSARGYVPGLRGTTGRAAPLTRYATVYCAARYITVVAVVVAVGVRSRQACARRQIPIPDRLVLAAARELLAVGTEAHGSDDGRMPPQGA